MKRVALLVDKIARPASRDFHFLRSHVSSDSPIIFAKSCQKLHTLHALAKNIADQKLNAVKCKIYYTAAQLYFLKYQLAAVE